MDSLAGKRALITGGASGIGAATALLFASEGAAISIADLDKDSADAVTKTILGSEGRVIFVPCDVTDAGQCQRAVEQTVHDLGDLNILVNCAGIIRRATVLESTEAEWDHVMAVNLKSIFLLCKYAIPIMAEAGGGTIINISSGWGLVGGPRAASYCASKGGVVQLTRSMALDHGGQNIRVNSICPGDTDTPLLRDEARQLGQPIEHFLAKASDRPLGRIGTPHDIAQAALYLASDASSFVTGTTLVVDGGGLAA